MTGSQNSSAARVVRSILAAPRPAAGGHTGGTGADRTRVLEQGRPARTFAARIAAAGGVDADTSRRLRELVDRHLADRARQWLGLHDALAGHRGTLPALLADVPPPVPPAVPGELRTPAPRSVHDLLALLLEHARPEHAVAALTALPDRTVAALLSGGPVPGAALVTAVVEHGDSRSRAALARHTRIDTRVLARLLDTADPEAGAAVYRNPRATQSLRRTLAHRLGAVPMDAALRAELSDPAVTVPRTWLAPLLGCGDPQLVARALGIGARGVAQQYALVRVWERCGADALRGLLGDPALTRRLNGPVVAAVARVDREADPAKLVKKLRRCRNHWEVTTTVAGVLTGVNWQLLEAAHEEEPLPHWGNLVTLSTAPADLRLRQAALVPEPGPDGLPDGADLTRARARHGLGGLYHCPPTVQLDGLLASGLLTGSDVVHQAAPAALILACLGSAARRADAPPEAAAALAEVAGLVRSRLGTDEEAWARVAERLTGRDPGWEPMSPVAALLSVRGARAAA